MIPPTMIYVWESIPIDSLCSIHNFIRLNHDDFVIHFSKLHSFIEQSGLFFVKSDVSITSVISSPPLSFVTPILNIPTLTLNGPNLNQP